MSFTVTLKVNSSPVNKIGKTLTTGTDFSCQLKDNTSILSPTLIVSSQSSLAGFNYMYISEFGRYYFIDDIRSVNNQIWEISAHVDVLETYATQILANTAVIRRQKSLFNLYLDDPEFKAYNTEVIKTEKFKGGSGLTKNLKYVLCVNGSYGVDSNSEGGDGDGAGT